MSQITIAMSLGRGCLLQEAVGWSSLGSKHGRVVGFGRAVVRPCRTRSLPELLTSISFVKSEISYSQFYHRQKTPSHVCSAGGKRQRKPRVWKTKVRRGSFAKSKKLVEIVMSSPDVKEELYGALDTWVAWELEFPLVAVKKAVKILQEMEEHKKVIQVMKWMLSKGQGKTMGTYEALIEAFSVEGRIDEADALWQEIFARHLECVPRIMFGRILHMYETHGLDDKAIELFFDMEDLGVRPDRRSVELIASIHDKRGDHKKAEQVLLKYPRPTFEWRRIRGKWIRLPVTTSPNDDPANESSVQYESGDEARVRSSPGTDADSEDYDFSSEEDDTEEGVREHEQREIELSDASLHEKKFQAESDERWSRSGKQQAMPSAVGNDSSPVVA